MKNYYGNASGEVTVSAGNDKDGRSLGKFEWGTPSASAASLARELLTDLLSDKLRAEKLYRRFMHRTVALWPASRPWGMSEAELKAVVDAIEKVETDTAPLTRQMGKERPQFVTDAAPPGGAWDQSPDIEPNAPTKKKP